MNTFFELNNLAKTWLEEASWELSNGHRRNRPPNYIRASEIVNQIRALGYTVVQELGWIPGEANKLTVYNKESEQLICAITGKQFNFK